MMIEDIRPLKSHYDNNDVENKVSELIDKVNELVKSHNVMEKIIMDYMKENSKAIVGIVEILKKQVNGGMR